MKNAVTLILALGAAAAAQAKTIAYWPLNYDVKAQAWQCRSVAGPFTLEAVGVSGAVTYEGQVTGLPPNLDEADLIDRPDGDGRTPHLGGYLTTTGLDAYLDVTNSWTVEGWFKLDTLPAAGGWYPLFTTREQISGWLMTLRNYSGRLDWELFAQNCVNDHAKFATNVLETTVTNVWHHYALVHNYTESGIPGKGVWHFYIDGAESPCAITNNQAITKGVNTQNRFTICGRKTTLTKWKFYADAIRIADEALTPDRFLNASSAQPRTTSGDTLGYWRFDPPYDVVNLAPTPYYLKAVGQVIYCSGDHAYDAIPNASSGLPASTASYVADFVNERLSLVVGNQVDYDAAFTLEGWFKCFPRQDQGCIFGTRSSSVGFSLWYNFPIGLQGLTLYACVTNAAGESVNAVNNFRFADPAVPLSGRWAHIALTHAPATAERGDVWQAFVDGTSMGVVTGRTAVGCTSGLTNLFVGTRSGSWSTTPIGLVDTVRLSKRVLDPSEFLCTVGGTSPAAADVAALWPFNRNGVHFDLRDTTGNTGLTGVSGTRSDFVADATVPTISNPPTDVDGNPTRNTGALQFPSGAEATGLRVVNGICTNLNLLSDFTVEGWLRFDRVPTSGWTIIWNAGNETQTPRWWLACRSISGSYRYISYCQVTRNGAQAQPINDNTVFPNSPAITSADIGKWKHHALVYRADAKTFELYIDGVSAGVVNVNADLLPATGMPFSATDALNIGGRSSTKDQNFPGSMDTLRITRRALVPSEFLNATPQTSPAAPATTAYWKLDANGTTATGLDSSVPGLWNGLTGSSVAGSSEQFGPRVRNPDASTNFVGDARANAGSVQVTSVGGLTGLGERRRVAIDRAFTLEGWIKWDGTGAFPQTVLSTDLSGKMCSPSWTLSLASADTFAVTARDAVGAIFLQGTFTSPVALAGAWTHLAFTYTPRKGLDGQCELFVDGVSAGTVTASVVPYFDATACVEPLLFGGSGTGNLFQGLFDTWRLSDGVREPETFLHLRDSGLIILVR